MNKKIRNGLCAVAMATLLNGCVIVIGDDDNYDDELVYADPVDHHSTFASSQYDSAYPSDTVVTDVRARFNGDEFLREEPILISASDGVVTLSGEVDDARTLERAVAVASQTPGVDSVVLKVVLTVQ